VKDESESILTTGFRRFSRCIVLAIALAITASGLWDRAYNWAVGDAIRDHNAANLDQSAKRAAALLIPVAAARGAVDVIEGSTMVVEFGDLMQPILDYLDLTWKVVLTASIAMVATKQLLDGTADLGSMFLVAAIALFFLLAVVLLFSGHQKPLAILLQRLAAMCLLVALLFYLVLPISIWTSAWLSERSTANITEEYEATFDELAAKFSMHEVNQSKGFLSKADGLKDKADELVNYVEAGGARDLGRSVIYVTVAYTLDGIVFPLLTLLFLLWFIRGSLYPMLGLQREKS
jgi:hypothetical protein